MKTSRNVVLIAGAAIFLFSTFVLTHGRELPVVQSIPGVQYANATEGLRLFLQDGVAAAKSGDAKKLDAFMRQIRIPDAQGWYEAAYGKGHGTDRGRDYARNVETHEKRVREVLLKMAREEGEITTRKVNDNPEPGRGMEWGMLDGLIRPTEFYLAEWRKAGTPKSDDSEPIGYFVFVDGRFRIGTTFYRVVLQVTHGNGESGGMDRDSSGQMEQSITGTTYKSPAGHFTLTIPEGWKINEPLSKAPMGIGAITNPERDANLLIQLMPTEESAAEFVRKLDENGTSVYEGYKKVIESPITLDGIEGDSLLFTHISHDTTIGVDVQKVMKALIVFVRVKDKFIIFYFVTPEDVFGRRRDTFGAILDSLHIEVR